MIADTINQKISQALKARDEVRLSTLRLLSSALNYEKIAKQHDLSGDEEIVVVRREAKKRQDAIEAYEKVDAKDRAEREKKEQEILKEFLPAEMPEGELNELISESIKHLGAKTMQDMGRVIGDVMKKAGGKAEGSKVSALVKKKLEP